ncbi:unnamed protein product [Cylicocyclus nassatus]|uniref:CHK kinase-like domain-containing protein n=1 Tax=Cylicocyclus nassatus TaxID=53992 RepID=A0AA36H3Q4_CYLNA|nr:unnamed protein product [Cylicocyclus nassatus]
MFESAADKYPPKVLLHGEPFASNIFRRLDNTELVWTIVDWTGCHSGCYGEDLAKAICWNLSTKDRLECTTSLLEEYYQHVMRYSGDLELTMNDVRKAYDAFLPVAMVTFTAKIMEMQNKGDVESLLERAKGLIENLYTLIKLNE